MPIVRRSIISIASPRPLSSFRARTIRSFHPIRRNSWSTALKNRGIPVGYFLFEGEEHGFRKAQNIQRALDAELYFYAALVLRSGLHF